MLSSKSGARVEYTYKSESKDSHRLWKFGALARLDWSKFKFTLPPPLRSKSQFMDILLDGPAALPRRKPKTVMAVADDEMRSYESDNDGIDVELDSDNDLVAFNSDADDNECMIFDGGDEVVDRDEECYSEDESERDGSEYEAILDDDDDDEEWINIEL